MTHTKRIHRQSVLSSIRCQQERELDSRPGLTPARGQSPSSSQISRVRPPLSAVGGWTEPVFWLSVSVGERAAAWAPCSLTSGCVAMSSGRRIRPERSAGAQRRNVQKLTWRDSHWLQGFSDDQRGGPSASLSDMGGGAALRRVLLLCERQQHREAAALLSRLAPAAFRALVAELPVEVLLEQLPASLPPLEALYARATFLEEPSTALQALKPDALVLQMVRLFAQQHDADRDGAAPWLAPPQMITSCKKLLKVRPAPACMLSPRGSAPTRAISGAGPPALRPLVVCQRGGPPVAVKCTQERLCCPFNLGAVCCISVLEPEQNDEETAFCEHKFPPPANGRVRSVRPHEDAKREAAAVFDQPVLGAPICTPTMLMSDCAAFNSSRVSSKLFFDYLNAGTR
ncbi:hypothetical protein HPB51_024169 [Rhipicephalus microplus]|uniref:Uncharacterized protein n=1 Tax=Rhipicephalus microplus TaxID=6941 RepID=A0A9J6DDB3_RHIMP|nr:hypothetical protein HPB51_024169 [Rhipicephalus microplus]